MSSLCLEDEGSVVVGYESIRVALHSEANVLVRAAQAQDASSQAGCRTDQCYGQALRLSYLARQMTDTAADGSAIDANERDQRGLQGNSHSAGNECPSEAGNQELGRPGERTDVAEGVFRA